MTHGLRTWRALGVGLGLLLAGLSGCTTPEKQSIAKPAQQRPVGPATPGGTMGQPGANQYNRSSTPTQPAMPAGFNTPSVQPNNATSMTNYSPLENGAVAQRNFQPGMSVASRPNNAATMPLQPSGPPSSAYPSAAQMTADYRMNSQPPAGGSRQIPTTITSLPPNIPMDADSQAGVMPAAGTYPGTGMVQPGMATVSMPSDGGIIPPSPPQR